MPSAGSRFVVVVYLAASVLTGVVLAQSPTPLGGEFQVSTYKTGAQVSSTIGIDNDGDFVVVWTSTGSSQDGSGSGIFAQLFDADGTRLGGEFQVNTRTSNNQDAAAVGMDGDGDFVVAWMSLDQDGAGYGVFGQRFNSAGVAQAVEFQVSAYTATFQSRPAVEMATAGDFVVAWQSSGQDGAGYGIFARRFGAVGDALGAEFQVNAFTLGAETHAVVDSNGGGDFVVAWRSSFHDGDSYGIFARRFDVAGVAQATEFQVNTYTTSNQSFADVGVASDGAFVIAWQSLGEDGSLDGVFAQRFDGGGIAQGTAFQVSAYTTSGQSYPRVGMASAGSFVVTWRSFVQDGSEAGIFARRFDAGGIAQGAEFEVNTHTMGFQGRPAIDMTSAGGFVVAWDSYEQDGDSGGVFAQRYQAPLAILDIDGNGSVGPLTDGLLAIRFLFGFTGSTLTLGAIDALACTRCTAQDVEAYLATLI